jgi:hypothetical protein
MQAGIKEASPPTLQQGYSIAHEGLLAGWLAFFVEFDYGLYDWGHSYLKREIYLMLIFTDAGFLQRVGRGDTVFLGGYWA